MEIKKAGFFNPADFWYNCFMTSKITIQNKLKFILSKYSIHNFEPLFKNFPLDKSHISFINKSVHNFLACRDLDKGYILYKCNSCGHSHKIALSCKSRLCPTCGFKYSATWTENISKDIIQCPHRHVIFTIPKQCREFFFYDRTLLSKLASAINSIFKYQFQHTYKKNLRVNYVPKSSNKFFTLSDVIHYGLITVIHSFGRDLKWNPHIHAIVSLGGFNKSFDFLNFKHFNVDSIAGQWKFHVLNIISKGKYPNNDIKLKAKKIINDLYKINIRFFFNVGDGYINNNKSVIKYLGRYLARAPIAEYKISNISHDSVTFFFYDLKFNKKKTFVTMPINQFISQIIIHLPPKNFKMISRFGFYARRKSHKLIKAIEPFKNTYVNSNFSWYERQSFNTFNINPFICPKCNVKMRVWEFYHYLYPPTRIYI